ncbi:MAG: MATE family efflux transporter, partial [Lachnospiraceae bacterium]|nr:MATE family efflux transporter [Lachnospiraceae bacterium]
MKSRETDFTTGKPSKLILSFYWPLLMTSMLQQFYNFADTWIVGKGLGDNALAAVGNMGSLFFLIVGFSFGIANGFGVLVAQSYGAG